LEALKAVDVGCENHETWEMKHDENMMKPRKLGIAFLLGGMNNKNFGWDISPKAYVLFGFL